MEGSLKPERGNMDNIILTDPTKDPEVQALIRSKLEKIYSEKAAELDTIKARLAVLGASSGSVSAPTKPAKSTKGVGAPGSRNHRQAILAVCAARPGMVMAEIREALANMGHEIDPKVLSQNLHTMKTEWVSSNGQKGLRVDGTRGRFTFYTK